MAGGVVPLAPPGEDPYMDDVVQVVGMLAHAKRIPPVEEWVDSYTVPGGP